MIIPDKKHIILNDLVSIITPSYNSSNFIQNAISSVQAQDYSRWEMIIIDDHSNDNSVEIISDFCKKDPRIILIKLEKNVGAARARNVGLMIAKGKYIAFLDSDDMWSPNKLTKQLAFMHENNYAFTFTSYRPFSDNQRKKYSIVSVPKTIDFRGYLKNTIIGCLTVIIDREKTGDFQMPIIRSSHDMALWLLIMKRGFRAYGLNEVLASYRIVSNSNTAKKWKAAKDVWIVYRNIENLSMVESLYNFCGYMYNAIKKRI